MDAELKTLQIDRGQRRPTESKPSKWAIRWIIGGVAVFVLLGMGRVTYEKLNAATEVETVRVAAASTGGANGAGVVLNATGYIVAHHPIDVSSKIVGKVDWVGVEKADRVKAGQVMVRLEDTEYRAQFEQAKANLGVTQAHLAELEHGSRPQEIDAARAQVEQAQADFDNDGIILKRTQDLTKQGIDPQSQLDTAQATYDMAKAKLNNAKKTYELVKIGPRVEEIDYARAQVAQAQAQVDYAQTMLDSTLIRSPVTGTVLDRLVEKGEMVSNMNLGGTGGVKASVVSLADLNDLQVELDINQNDFARLTPHEAGNVVADAYPDRVYKGVIAEVAPEANRQKATIQVKVKVLQPDEYLRPEMNASVAFLADDKPAAGATAAARPVIVVPASAVKSDAVFVVLGGKAVRRPVKTGMTTGQGVRVDEG
ncbi:MAG TPA: efflux RND transporter periplasmic adaptor subunit, partial [Terriglobia bacterium]|nr:efflux RND transporter periplasmic adaptor subunit [Terriglobia bacterium]